MIDYSNITDKPYEIEKCVFFRNLTQSAFYVHHNCKIVDVFTDSNMKLVFVFTKEDHKKILPLWMENKIENSD